MYRREKQDKKVILIMWVDDLIVATSDEDLLNSVKRMLAERFRMKDLGRLNHFLGIDFNQTEGQVQCWGLRVRTNALEYSYSFFSVTSNLTR